MLEFCCDQRSNNLGGILNNLLAQLLQKAGSDIQTRNEGLVKGIIHISQKLGKTFVIIDGLYECAGFEAILQDLKSLTSDLHIFVSSRDHPKIRKAFGSCEKIIISERYIAEDVKRFVKIAMQWLNLKVDSDEIKALSNTRGTCA